MEDGDPLIVSRTEFIHSESRASAFSHSRMSQGKFVSKLCYTTLIAMKLYVLSHIDFLTFPNAQSKELNK